MTQIKLTIAYDATGYKGWQKTSLGPSIEEELERVLGRILQSPLALEAASRTDAGVHAEGQVVGLRLAELRYPLDRLLLSANGLLPPEIRLLAAEEVDDRFHATLDAKGKEYCYSFCLTPTQLPKWRHTSWHCRQRLDRDKMREAAGYLVGRHDFAAFCNRPMEYETTVRELRRIEWVDLPEGRLELRLEGTAFLFRMARNIAGTLYSVGCGKIAAEAIPDILESGRRERAGVTAPAHGLCLRRVDY